MSETATAPASLSFTPSVLCAPLPLEASFDGGRLTSDDGLPWLSEADAVLGLCPALAAVVPEWRHRAGSVRHSLEGLVRQRVFQIACGYEDQNDAAALRTDPLLKLVCGRLPESGPDLASQPTFSRLENAVRATTCYRLAWVLGQRYLIERERLARDRGAPGGVPRRILLDLDGTDDPTHGEQEGTASPGYYQQHMYFPLLIFDGDTDQLVTAVLRPGNVHGSHGVVAVLKRVVRALRARWPDVRIELRADSGFAVPALYDWCEAERIDYTIGLMPNPRLETLAAPLLQEAHRQHVATGTKVRLAGETPYQAGSWPHPRRVAYKAEALAAGPNTRFVVTTRKDAPLVLYDFYVDRGIQNCGSRTSSAPVRVTASVTTALSPTSVASSSTPSPTGCWTPCAAGSRPPVSSVSNSTRSACACSRSAAGSANASPASASTSPPAAPPSHSGRH